MFLNISIFVLNLLRKKRWRKSWGAVLGLSTYLIEQTSELNLPWTSVPDQDKNICSLEVNFSSEQSSSASNKSFRHDSPEQVDAENVRNFINSSSSESEYENVKNVKLGSDLWDWVNKHDCMRQCVNDLLKIPIENGHELPKDCRTLVELFYILEKIL